MPELVDIVSKLDGPLVAIVLGLQLKWALANIEKKDNIIVDIAQRSSKTIEALLEQRRAAS